MSGSNGKWLNSGTLIAVPLVSNVERIAVRGAGQSRARCGNAAGARLVLDDEVLAQILLQSLGDETRRDVGYAARPERQDHADRMIGIIRLRLRARRGRGKAGGNRRQRENRGPAR